ncbi:hypothetical protein [Solicola sp. PLA-1-18]|uniref:hypothetical protein n=1 Tax=Solicola sp. PLA-1-18 TaxID=3380532 RepID=UPI003B800318
MRRLLLVLQALVVAAGLALPALPAAAEAPDVCATNPAACTVGTRPTEGDASAPSVGSVDDGAQGIVSPSVETEQTLAAIKEFTPENAVDSWAQASAEGAVSILGKVSTWQDRVTTPAFDRSWWRDQYAVMFGLSLLLFAFMLVIVVARVGGPDGSVPAAQLMRDSGLKLWLVPVILAIAPIVLSLVQGTTAELARSFADETGDGAGDATTQFLSRMTAVSGGFDSFGGAILALLVLMGILVFSVALLIEVAVASWGLNLLGLVVPIAVVMHVYPPWRRPLARIAGLMLGLMFTPVAVNFVYWTFFSATENLANGLDLFGTALFVLIGTMLLCAAPILVMQLFGVLVPQYAGPAPAMAGGGRGEVPVARSVTRLADHFRTKEAFAAQAPMVHAHERASVGPQHAGSQGDTRTRTVDRPDPPRRAAAADRPEREPDPGVEVEAAQAHEEVAAQLGKKNADEAFDPEPFDAPRPPGEPRDDGWWHR